MNWVEAEVCKLAVNTYVTTKISYANMLAELCENLPGANCDVVSNAIGCDTRIGNKYLKGAVAYGGPCFPRDNKAFFSLGKRLGVCTSLVQSTDYQNSYQTSRISRFVVKHLDSRSEKIGILGLSYKPGTPVVDQSQGIDLAKVLTEQGLNVCVHDVMADVANDTEGLAGINIMNTTEEVIESCEVLVMMTPWPEYIELFKSTLSTKSKVKVFIDPWRVVAEENFIGRCRYIPMGIGSHALTELSIAAE
jgi:UDPglucose 6-dehydrogenase